MKARIIPAAGAILSLAAFGAFSVAEGHGPDKVRVKSAIGTEAAACCRNKSVAPRNIPEAQAYAEELFSAKYGRKTPAAEARERLAAEESAKHLRACLDLGKCATMRADLRPAPKPPPAAVSAQETLFRAKYGRALPGRKGSDVLLATAAIRCEHECCKRDN